MSIENHVWEDAWIYDALMHRVISTHHDGRVMRGARDSEVAMPLVRSSANEPHITLVHVGITKIVPVARVVAIDQLANPHSCPDVLHVNGDLGDCRPGNLFWGYDSYRDKKKPSKISFKLGYGLLISIRYGKDTVEDVCRQFPLSESDVRRIRKHDYSSHVAA